MKLSISEVKPYKPSRLFQWVIPHLCRWGVSLNNIKYFEDIDSMFGIIDGVEAVFAIVDGVEVLFELACASDQKLSISSGVLFKGTDEDCEFVCEALKSCVADSWLYKTFNHVHLGISIYLDNEDEFDQILKMFVQRIKSAQHVIASLGK